MAAYHGYSTYVLPKPSHFKFDQPIVILKKSPGVIGLKIGDEMNPLLLHLQEIAEQFRGRAEFTTVNYKFGAEEMVFVNTNSFTRYFDVVTKAPVEPSETKNVKAMVSLRIYGVKVRDGQLSFMLKIGQVMEIEEEEEEPCVFV